MRRGDAAVLGDLAADVDAGYPAFVRQHAGAVYTTALRLSARRADVDDIAQETFIRAYRALRRYEAPRIRALHARAWLLAITVNVCRNAARHEARRPRPATRRAADGADGADGDTFDVPDSAPGPATAAENNDDRSELVALLAQLPAHQRVPVVLRHVVGLSYEEVAAALECPVGTAKAHVARGVKQLRVLAAEASASPQNPGKTGKKHTATTKERP